MAARGNLRLGQRDEWPQQLQTRIRAEAQGVAHRAHKIFAAVRVNRVVAGMGGDD